MSKEITDLFTITERKGVQTYKPNILGLYQVLANLGYKVYKEAEIQTLYLLQGPILYLKEQIDLSFAIDNYLYKHFPACALKLIEGLNQYGRSKISTSHNWCNLPLCERATRQHNENSATFYFLNCYAVITAKGVTTHPYKALPAGTYIFSDQVIQRNLNYADINDDVVIEKAPRGYDFYKFLHAVSSTEILDTNNNQAEHQPDDAKFMYLLRLLGFLLHSYRRRGFTDFAVIFCDDDEGGTGKGLLMQAVAQLVKVAEIDAKKDIEKYSPEGHDKSTRVKVYNDITETFNLQVVYNEITDSGTYRPMHKSPVVVPYNEMWKVAILSNFHIKGFKSADKRRQKVFRLTAFFNEQNTVANYFKHSFFSDDWSPTDWDFFYSLMFACVNLWLKLNYKTQELNYTDSVLASIQQESNYPEPLREYCKNLMPGWHSTGELVRTYKDLPEVQQNRFWRDTSSVKTAKQIIACLKESGRNPVKNCNRTEVHVV